jgi:Copper transport outer membrane protein, MctB
VFDLRYHVASLTAVFIALVIGILVGIGLSGRGFVDDAERRNLNQQISDLRAERKASDQLLDAAERRDRAMQEFAEKAYPVLAPGRLDDKRVAVLYVGSADPGTDVAIGAAVRDAGGRIARMRALRVPISTDEVDDVLAKRPALRGYVGEGRLEDLGRDLARELAAGAKTPLWDALGGVLVEEREGPPGPAVDALVVARSASPQTGPTAQFLAGLYGGLARSGMPAVGVEVEGAARSAITAFLRNGLSTVDSIETPSGRLALVLLLGGARPGNYGVEATANDGVLPPIAPLG